MLHADEQLELGVGATQIEISRDLPELNVGLAIQTFIQVRPPMPTPTHKMTRASASHSHPGLTSSDQNVDILPKQMNAA